MSKAIYTAVSGLQLDMRRQEVIARNIAATNIPGFKREYMLSQEFQKALGSEVENNTTTPEKQMDEMNGTTPGVVKVDFSQGNLKNTERTLDFAINGEGFFEVTTKDNQKFYTRNGVFFVSNEGKLVTAEGYPISGDGGDIQFAIDDNVGTLRVTSDGLLKVRQGADANYAMKEIGRVKVVAIDNTDKLKRVSANYFALPDPNQVPNEQEPEKYTLVNNFLETANSEPVQDMVSMIECQRQFDMGQKLLRMLEDSYNQEFRYYNI